VHVTTKRTLLVLALVFLALDLSEQLLRVNFYYSRLVSTTHVDDKMKAPAGDLVSSIQIDKPLTRWLPIVKFGESVFYHTYQHVDGAKVFELDATTRTKLLVLGLCSTSKYDELARAPFDEVHREYLGQMKRMPNHATEPTPASVTRPAGQAARQP
jgi:hypothetical protein